MKRTTLLLLLLLLLPTPFAQAQTAVTLQSLEVELWPDYDREAVLVLLTGTLPANMPLPVTITLPLPDDIDFNVVARITPEDVMTDQGVTPQFTANQVTFEMTESRFRVEYYQPYIVNDTQRRFVFSWQTEMVVEQMNVTVQQPIAASNLTTIPSPAAVGEGEDGLTYHTLPNQAVAANDNYTVEINYTMTSPQLTVSFSTPDTPSNAPPVLETTAAEGEKGYGIDWPLILFILGGLILGGTAVYYLINRQTAASRRPAKPKPHRTPRATKGKVKFCHQCGKSLQTTDKFCRQCGTAVKR